MTNTDPLALVVAICTFAYTVINLMMWFESRATRKQKNAPNIIAYLKSGEPDQIIFLKIKNIGEGCAKDVNVEVLKDYNQVQKDGFSLTELGVVKDGFSIFPPQYELKYIIDVATKVDYNSNQSYIKLKINYKQLKGKKIYTNSFELPFSQLRGQNYVVTHNPETQQLLTCLKDINTSIKQIKN